MDSSRANRIRCIRSMPPFAAIINTNHAPIDASLLRGVMGAPCQTLEIPIKVDGCIGLASLWSTRNAVAELTGSDGQVWAVMDGRLDDRDGLIAALVGTGAPADLRQLPDTALLARAYYAWGDDCVSRLIGDFSFCLWDSRHRRLLCARDHFGVKPLYFARLGSVLVISSALRVVRRHPAVSRQLRSEAIGDFLLLGMCAELSQTAFRDVSRVPPAHRLTYSLELDALRVTRYWALEPGDPIRYADPREYVDQFCQLLRVAVADRVRSKPLGVLMSGGLDSSSVAVIAADVLGAAASERLRAFTVVYDTLMRDEERHHSTVVARTIGIPISHVAADQYQPFGRWEQDSLPPEPSLEGLTAIMLDVLDLVSRHGDAVLTGDGGDPMLLPTPVSDQVGRVSATRLLTDVFGAWRRGMRPPFGIRSRLVEWLGESQKVPGWLGRDLLESFDACARWQEIQARRNVDRTARSTAVNEVIDPWWTSTFESFDSGATQRPVELRYAFFDVRLASFVLRLPSFPWCLNKHVLREATRGMLPESVRTRSKTPLAGSPWGAAGQWSSQRAVDLFEATPEIDRFVDVRKFRTMVEGDSLLSGETLSAWAAISLAMWLRCDAKTSAASGTA